MIKKMMLLALSVGALAAFAVPTVASAQLKEGGVALKTGVEVTATSTNLETVATGLGTKLTCKLVTIHMKLVKNNAGANGVEATNVATTTSECSSPITVANAGTIDLGAGVGVATGATFLVSGVCDFTGNIPFSYVSGTSTLTVTGTSQFNGNCGAGDMTGSFTLETSNGTPITVS